jgi:hypothetical protein
VLGCWKEGFLRLWLLGEFLVELFFGGCWWLLLGLFVVWLFDVWVIVLRIDAILICITRIGLLFINNNMLFWSLLFRCLFLVLCKDLCLILFVILLLIENYIFCLLGVCKLLIILRDG